MNNTIIKTNDFQEIKSKIKIANQLLSKVVWNSQSKKTDAIQAFISTDERLVYPAIKCSVELNCEAETLYKFLVVDILETASEWGSTFCDGQIVETSNENEQLVATYYHGKPARMREDIFYRNIGWNGAAYFEHSIGLEGYDHVSLNKPNSVRSEMHLCTKEIIPIGEKVCKYNVMWQYNPKGKLGLLHNKIMAKMVLNNLKGELKKLQEKYN